MQNAGYLLAAFTAAWVVLFAYVLSLLRRQRRLQQEIDTLKNALRQKQ